MFIDIQMSINGWNHDLLYAATASCMQFHMVILFGAVLDSDHIYDGDHIYVFHFLIATSYFILWVVCSSFGWYFCPLSWYFLSSFLYSFLSSCQSLAKVLPKSWPVFSAFGWSCVLLVLLVIGSKMVVQASARDQSLE